MTHKTVLLFTALMLGSTAVAGGAGPRVTMPGQMTVNPVQPATAVLNAQDLQRVGSFPVLATEQGVPLMTLTGPTVTLAAGSPQAAYLMVTRDGQSLRYTLTRPLVAGKTVTLREITVVRGSEVRVTTGAMTSAQSGNSVIPVKANSTAQVGTVPTQPGKVTLCHRTASASNPYTLITISTNALATHQAHGDFVSSEAQGCPAGVKPSNAASPATPANPGNNAVAVTPATPAKPEKVTLCHRTASASNPYTLITISTNALATHQAHGDFVSSEAQGCPAGVKPSNAASPATPANPGNGNGNGATPATPANPGGGNGNGTTPAIPATPAQPGTGNGASPATPAQPAQPGKGK